MDSVNERIEEQKKKLNTFIEHMKEFLGMTRNGKEIDQSATSLLSGFIFIDDNSKDYVDSAMKLYIDKYEQAYSMAFYGFSSQKSREFMSTTFGSRINDEITYKEVVDSIASNTDKKNIFKYKINDEGWLLNKLEEIVNEPDVIKREQMRMQLPEVIITPADVCFSDRVTELLCNSKIDIPVQRVGVIKEKQVLGLGDVIKYNRETGMQDINQQSIFDNAMQQINSIVVQSKMEKLRKFQKEKVNQIEERANVMGAREAIDYILAEVEELYKEYDYDTYLHIDGMKKKIETFNLGLPEDKKLTDYEKKTLERMVILHDVGKLSIPKQIVAGRELQDYEKEIMNTHVSLDNASMFNNEVINGLLSYALNHHMALDMDKHNSTIKSEDEATLGVSDVGYGDKRILQNSNNRLVQILHVIDVYDALSSKRSYKNAFPKEKTISIMNEDIQNGKMNPEYVKYMLMGAEIEENQKNKCA